DAYHAGVQYGHFDHHRLLNSLRILPMQHQNSEEPALGLEDGGLNEFIARWFSKNDVKYLEKVATAYFVSSKHPREPMDVLAQRINSLKPHVDKEAALEALKIVDEKRGEGQRSVAA